MEVWEASWQRLGSHLGVFGEPFWGCLERLGPKKPVKGGKILVKRPSHLDFNFGMIFDGVWMVFLVPENVILLKKSSDFHYQRAFRLF